MGAEEGDLVGELGRHPAQALLGLDLEPVARLDLDSVIPAAIPSARRARARASSSSSPAARVASVVTWIPPAAYGLARHPGRELLAAVAGEDEVGVAVDEAGDHAAPGGVEALVGRRARALDRGDAPVLDHQGRVADDPERPLAELWRRW